MQSFFPKRILNKILFISPILSSEYCRKLLARDLQEDNPVLGIDVTPAKRGEEKHGMVTCNISYFLVLWPLFVADACSSLECLLFFS